MSIHITISANAEPLERIRIDNTGVITQGSALDPTYVYEVIRYGVTGTRTDGFKVEHRYADGAVELASIALDQILAREQASGE